MAVKNLVKMCSWIRGEEEIVMSQLRIEPVNAKMQDESGAGRLEALTFFSSMILLTEKLLICRQNLHVGNEYIASDSGAVCKLGGFYLIAAAFLYKLNDLGV